MHWDHVFASVLAHSHSYVLKGDYASICKYIHLLGICTFNLCVHWNKYTGWSTETRLVQPIELINQNTHSSSPRGSEVSRDSHQPNKRVSHPCRTNTCWLPLLRQHFSASLLITILLVHVKMPAEPCLSAPCLFPGEGNVTQRLLTSVPHFHVGGPNGLTLCVLPGQTKGCDIYKAQSNHFRSYPHEYISTLYISSSFGSAYISR